MTLSHGVSTINITISMYYYFYYYNGLYVYAVRSAITATAELLVTVALQLLILHTGDVVDACV